MSLYRLFLRRTASASSSLPLIRTLHHISNPAAAAASSTNPIPSSTRTFAFSSAEEAAAERRRRKRRLRIEPPLHAIQRNPNPPPRDPNAPRLPDSTSNLVGARLNLHNRVQSLIRAFDLDAASQVARLSVYSGPRPTVFTCNAIISAMYRAKRYNDAVALFKYFFEQHDIVPNVVSYNNLINTYCDEGRVDTGIEVYRHIIATAPFSPSPVTYRHLTKGLIDAGRIGEAVDLLREMLTRGHGADSLVYNNVIKGFLELGNVDRANEFFDELKERCLVYDGVVNATFMDWWFQQGKDKEAMESYKSLLDKKFRMPPATCNTLLEVLLRYGKKEAAWKLFEQMLDNHTPPNIQAVNSDTFNIMVNECFKEGKFAEAVDTFKKVGTKPGSKAFAMDVAGYNNIIVRFCDNGMLEEAEKFFAELSSKSLTPDVTSYRTLIDAYLKIERVDDVLRLFDRMVEAGLRVVASFGTKVFGELVKNGKALESAHILAKMGEKDKGKDLNSDPLIYDVVVRGLCDAGSLDMGKVILEQMMRYGVGIPPALKQFVTEAFGNVGWGEEIGRVLDENSWRTNYGSYRATRQPRMQSVFPGMARGQQSAPSIGAGQSQMPRQPPYGHHQMAGQMPSGSPQMAAQQPVRSHNMSAQQSSGPYQMAGAQPSWPSQVVGQQSSCSSQMGQMGGQQPSWSSPMGQMGTQQPSQSSPMGQMGTQLSRSSPMEQMGQMRGEQPSWSSPMGQMGAQQPSQSTPVGQMGTQLSRSSQMEQMGQMGGQQPSHSSQIGEQQSSWSSQMGGQQPLGFPHTAGHDAYASSQFSRQMSFGASKNTGEFQYGSPSVSGQNTAVSSQMAGQPQWQDNHQQPNGSSAMAGQNTSDPVEWLQNQRRAAA